MIPGMNTSVKFENGHRRCRLISFNWLKKLCKNKEQEKKETTGSLPSLPFPSPGLSRLRTYLREASAEAVKEN